MSRPGEKGLNDVAKASMPPELLVDGVFGAEFKLSGAFVGALREAGQIIVYPPRSGWASYAILSAFYSPQHSVIATFTDL